MVRSELKTMDITQIKFNEKIRKIQIADKQLKVDRNRPKLATSRGDDRTELQMKRQDKEANTEVYLSHKRWKINLMKHYKNQLQDSIETTSYKSVETIREKQPSTGVAR